MGCGLSVKRTKPHAVPVGSAKLSTSAKKNVGRRTVWYLDASTDSNSPPSDCFLGFRFFPFQVTSTPWKLWPQRPERYRYVNTTGQFFAILTINQLRRF